MTLFLASASAEHGPVLPMDAPVIWDTGFFPITNSMIYAWIIGLLIFIVLKVATYRMQEVPTGIQNFVEMTVEWLQNFAGGLLEPKVMNWAFPLVATYFIFILLSNLMGLLPGVGSLGYGEPDPNSLLPFALKHADTPFFRPPTADANMTIAMGIVFFVMSTWWAIKYNGVGGLIHHLFGVKGGSKGLMFILLSVIFLMVGLIEMISIMIRPIALAMRLYGNVYGGESVLTIMLHLLPYGLAAVPFYFFELIICVVQSLVFTILCMAFIGSLCSHSEEHEEGAEGSH